MTIPDDNPGNGPVAFWDRGGFQAAQVRNGAADFVRDVDGNELRAQNFAGAAATAASLATKARVTTEPLEVYVDGTSGDDDNDGLTVSTPKETLQAAFDLIPEIVLHNVIVHCTGVMSEQGHVRLMKFIPNTGARIIIDGGDNWTTEVSGVADQQHTVAGVGTSGVNQTLDEYIGYSILVNIAGAADVQQRRCIQGNTATNAVYTFTKELSDDPAVTDTFEVQSPATEWTASTVYSAFYICCPGGGQVSFQRMKVTGSKVTMYFVDSYVRFSHFLMASTLSSSTLNFYGSVLNPEEDRYGVDGGYSYSPGDDSAWGLSIVGTKGLYMLGGRVTGWRPAIVSLGRAELRDGLSEDAFRYGSRFKGGVKFYNWNGHSPESGKETFINDSGYATTTVDSADTAANIYTEESKIIIGGGVDLSGDGSTTTWCVEQVGGVVGHMGVVAAATGAENGGLYCTRGGRIWSVSGSDPTYSIRAAGNVDISVDGVAEFTPWGTALCEVGDGVAGACRAFYYVE